MVFAPFCFHARLIMDDHSTALTIKTAQTPHWGLRHDADFYPHHAPDLAAFSPLNPMLDAQPVARGGRQAAWYVHLPDGRQGVLRHYRRGGMVARLFHDQYLWCGAQRTRSWAEFEVMHYLYQQGVAVPRPVAALWQKQSFHYRAALITERIDGARTLAQGLDEALIVPVARALKHMHDAGVDHADLNVFNILVDGQDQVWLIDFDRARHFETLSFARRYRNLVRLRRSLIKEFGPVGQRWYEQLLQTYKQWLLEV